ncbi:hypothetical protein HNR21_001953 [Actinomadura cellulosilytica]|uniref:Uncharacterized protein n=1 Tax=Thermomonospora cellulosilytica TaxID=1411118 RepID=A0A7W3MWB8_9ACTN|nr:hypothetical protein [Thermomonospora cellulosilytica]
MYAGHLDVVLDWFGLGKAVAIYQVAEVLVNKNQ